MSEPAPVPAAADRNLLYGILALQMDFISRDALITAMHAWVLDKSKPLGAILQEQGALTAERLRLLEALVAEHLRAHQGDPQRSLAAVSSASSVRDELHSIADADLHASLAHVGAGATTHLESTVDQRPAPGDGSAPLRYRVLRPHAKGGLGEVFVAQDQELHRQVALKEIHKEQAHDPHSRARFLLEAEITGRLEHPGIVPVYGLGCYPDGRPFYAMRFVKGDNLKEAIRRFHAADQPGRDPTERSLAFRDLLGRFVDVCQAVAYAHSRGVLHRDLKPGNVMLGKYGETLLVDWGLAKPVGRPESASPGDEATLRPSSGSGVAATVAGTALGTPAYMSPEQAAGRLEEVGPASDIYGLGATLYALLTGQAPFPGSDKGEVLRQVQRGDVVPPRQVKPTTPAALEAVCLQAMAQRPEDRYRTALELAADIEHWLADEPVAAYREPLAARAGRWVRRHRPLAAGLAAALAVAVLLGGAGLLWLQREAARKRLAVEAALARVSELQQQGHWKEAQAVLDQAADRLGNAGPEDLAEHIRQAQADLKLVARLDAIRQQRATIVEGKFGYRTADRDYAKTFAEAGLGQEGDEAEAVAARMRASAIQAALVAALDDWAATTADAKRRAWLLAVARQADPDPWRDRFRDPDVWRDRTALQRLADGVLKTKGTNGAALSPQTLAALGLALETVNGDPVPLLTAAQARHPGDFWLSFHLGLALAGAKKPGEAVGYFRAALALRPESTAVQNDLGNALQDQGRLDEAIGHYLKALELDPNYARAHYNLGLALYTKRRLDEAIGHYQKALDLDPNFAGAHINLGLALYTKRRLDEAIGHYQKALDLDPKDAKAHNNLGRALKDMGRLDEAIAHFRTALDLDRKDAKAHNNLGTALEAKGRLDQAIRHYLQALEIDPKLAQAHGALGQALLGQGRFAEARQATRRCLELLAVGDPLRPSVTRQLEKCERFLALEKKLPALLKGQTRPADAAEGITVALLCQQHKRLYAAAVRFYAAAFTAEPKLADDLQSGHRYNAACVAALAAAGKGEDAAKLADPERAKLRQQALTWLTADLAAWTPLAEKGPPQARTAVPQTLRHWQQDPDLAGVRGDALARLPAAERDAWRKLWADVDALLKRAGTP
jgi:tetratricopeptide (TPR) repeat protein/tRNA A-37 threonylcarbamoyl transferase component Bud32